MFRPTCFELVFRRTGSGSSCYPGYAIDSPRRRSSILWRATSGVCSGLRPRRGHCRLMHVTTHGARHFRMMSETRSSVWCGMRARLERDFERFKRELPGDFPHYIRSAYRIDLTARYLGYTIPHPIGKASGQLSLSVEQLDTDRAAGLAFVVLKTVIAEDAEGSRSMGAWAVHETRMKVERRSSASGQEGWTVTWKGRGWDRSLDEYLGLVRAAADLTRSGDMVAVPSVKYHLPRLSEPFRAGEYRHTTGRLAEAWRDEPLPLGQDFSPPLAGDSLADERHPILRLLREA